MSIYTSAMSLTGATHSFVGWLLYPVIAALIVLVTMSLFEIGTSIGERFWGLKEMRKQSLDLVQAHGRRRIERADLLARIAPMLGLMGTLIPLGPGLAGLGQGDLGALTDAIMIAFDTTVLGLLAGAIGFAIGRLRRRWYDELMDLMENGETL